MNFFDAVLEPIGAGVINLIATLGYVGIGICMAIESACIPLPSEIIMPFSGSLVAAGRFNLWLVGLTGAVGCLVGSVVTYVIGYYGGRPFVEKYGKYLLISKQELAWADKLFYKYGDITVFVTRLLPFIRTFISLPAGICRMRFTRFCVYTFVGSFPWCLGLAFVGYKMGQHWGDLRTLFHRFDMVILGLIVGGMALWVTLHILRARKSKAALAAEQKS